MKVKDFERKLETIFIITLIILDLFYIFLASGAQMLDEDT